MQQECCGKPSTSTLQRVRMTLHDKDYGLAMFSRRTMQQILQVFRLHTIIKYSGYQLLHTMYNYALYMKMIDSTMNMPILATIPIIVRVIVPTCCFNDPSDESVRFSMWLPLCLTYLGNCTATTSRGFCPNFLVRQGLCQISEH